MFSWLANAWRVPELRKRVLFTALILALYRLGSWIPAPGVDSARIKDFFSGQGGTLLGFLNIFSGGALSQFSLFALGIMPYVTASIILQLLTVALAAAQSTGYALLFRKSGALHANTGRLVLIIVTLTAGTTLLMWFGEQITKRGVGNGISLLIFAGIVSLKVNVSGVMPIIFASALLSIPGTIASFIQTDSPIWQGFFSVFNYNSLLYAVLYLLLILAFNYFYVAIQYNPVEIANNLRKNNGAIPGIRPGKPTSDFITKCLSKITFVGAIFLGVIAVMPIIMGNVAGMNIQLGGTSLLIVVGVALDTGRSMESYMLMRHHKGFLE